MKLVFLDLDGTLFTKGKFVEESKRILDDISSKGNIFCIATGRTLDFVKKLDMFDNREGYFILENGCVIGSSKNNEFQVLKEWENQIKPHLIELSEVASFFEKNYEIIYRNHAFSIRTYDNLEVPEKFQDSTVYRNCDILDFMPKIAGKRNAAEYLMKKLGLDKENTIHIGDSLNDYDLLEFTGTCGTVDNADPIVKKLVSSKGGIISSQNETEGVRDILSKLSLL